MSTTSILCEREVIHASFRAACAEQESLDAQLSESLAALAAYQSHLDTWQQQLACERAELQLLREAAERERAAAQEDRSRATAHADAELGDLRQTHSELTAELQTRTEELRQRDERHAALVAELELARAEASSLQSALDDQQPTLERERAEWADESQRLRKLLEERAEASEATPPVAVADSAPASEPARPSAGGRESSSNGAVLGSIVEQFGKLRQQRAMGRQSSKKTR